MVRPMLMIKRVIRFIGNELKIHSPAKILIAVVTVVFIVNIAVSNEVSETFGDRREMLRDKQNIKSQIVYENGLKRRNNRLPLEDSKVLNKESSHEAEMLANTKAKYPTHGYDRALFLRERCSKLHSRRTNKLVRVSYDANHTALFCPLCKLASTFWTRVFQMMARNSHRQIVKHPFEVPISAAPRSNQYFNIFDQRIDDKSSGIFINAKDSFRFLFVRDPFSLLFSAYVDKIVGPNPIFWETFKGVGVPKSRTDPCGAGLSFEQFLRNIVRRYNTRHILDCHVSTFDACQPCAMNYTFVAKMETFKEDTLHILERLNQTQALKIFEDKFSSLHADDAIDDSTSGPFIWRSQITRCISWSEALKRIWRKLQIRGIIGGHGFPLSDNEVDTLTRNQFVKLLHQTRLESSSKERSWLKNQAYKEAYKNVSSDILDEIRKIYSNEFLLFDYKDLLDEIYDDSNFQNYGLFNYNNISDGIIM